MKTVGWRWVKPRPASMICFSVAACQRPSAVGASCAVERAEILTICLTPARTAASTTLPCSSTWAGFAWVQRKMRSTSGMAASIVAGSAMSPLAISISSSSAQSILAGSRTKARTGTALLASSRTTSPPIRPVAPVTRIIGCLLHRSVFGPLFGECIGECIGECRGGAMTLSRRPGAGRRTTPDAHRPRLGPAGPRC